MLYEQSVAINAWKIVVLFYNGVMLEETGHTHFWICAVDRPERLLAACYVVQTTL